MEPDLSAETWGWRRKMVGLGDQERAEWQPQGKRVGWLAGNDLYLDPESAHAEAQKLATEKGESLSITSRTLSKRLHEKGLLLTTEQDRGKLTVRKSLEGRRQEVWHLCALGFFSASEIGPIGPEPLNLPGNGPIPWADSWDENGPSGENRPSKSAQQNGRNGPLGRLGRFREGVESPGDDTGTEHGHGDAYEGCTDTEHGDAYEG
jgi:hypothetical protein